MSEVPVARIFEKSCSARTGRAESPAVIQVAVAIHCQRDCGMSRQLLGTLSREMCASGFVGILRSLRSQFATDFMADRFGRIRFTFVTDWSFFYGFVSEIRGKPVFIPY
jgi:hypothetical protein